MEWKYLTRLEDWDELLALSDKGKVAVFKHSTRCGISSYVLKRLEGFLKDKNGVIDHIYMLDLIRHRDISNAVADQLSVVHESPQLIIIENSKAVYHASHQAIDASVLLTQSTD
jgi:bacillithiol system protein YtxJ